jgi:hypothetical protein
LARALAWHARGHRFESGILHVVKELCLARLLFLCPCGTSGFKRTEDAGNKASGSGLQNIDCEGVGRRPAPCFSRLLVSEYCRFFYNESSIGFIIPGNKRSV